MKKAASIISWICGFITLLIGYLYLAAGWSRQEKVHPTEAPWEYQYVTHRGAYPLWAWILWTVICLIIIGVMIFREISVRRGYKVLAGILTIIFVSKIGGVLTLCLSLDVLCADDTRARSYELPNPCEPEDVLAKKMRSEENK